MSEPANHVGLVPTPLPQEKAGIASRQGIHYSRNSLQCLESTVRYILFAILYAKGSGQSVGVG